MKLNIDIEVPNLIDRKGQKIQFLCNFIIYCYFDVEVGVMRPQFSLLSVRVFTFFLMSQFGRQLVTTLETRIPV